MGSMILHGDIRIESVNLSADIPVRSAADFRVFFYLSSPRLNRNNRRVLAQKIHAACVSFETEGPDWSDDVQTLGIGIAEKDHPGLCRHLVEMFMAVGITVSAMGGNWQNPPFLMQTPPPENLPAFCRDFGAFCAFLGQAAEQAIAAKPAAGGASQNYNKKIMVALAGYATTIRSA